VSGPDDLLFGEWPDGAWKHWREVTPVPEVVCESNADHASAVSVLEAERDRLRALLKQAHDRDKWQGEFPTIGWYDDVARYFQRECVRERMTG
jgi:hypothetical protein